MSEQKTVVKGVAYFAQEAVRVCGKDGPALDLTPAAESSRIGLTGGQVAMEPASAVGYVVRDGAPDEQVPVRFWPPQAGSGGLIEASCVPLGLDDASVAEASPPLRDGLRSSSVSVGRSTATADFRSLVESATLPAVIVQQGRIVYANPATAQYLKAPLREILGAPMTQFIHPEDRNLVTQRHLARLRGEQPPAHYNLRVLTRTGETLRVALDVASVGWEGAPATFSFLKDVTKLTQAQERIEQAERIAHIGSYDFDIVQNRLVWSSELFRIFEADPEHFVPDYDGFMARVHPEDRAAVEHAYQQSLEVETECEIVHRIVTAGGQIKYLHQRWRNYFDDRGRPLRTIGTAQNITDRKLAEQAVEEGEQWFFAIFYRSDAAAFLFSGLRIIDCNQAAARMLGYTSREALLEACHSILDISPRLQPDGTPSDEKVRDLAGRALEHGHQRHDWRCHRQDGAELDVRLSLTPVTIRGVKLLYGAARDVTAEREVQQRLGQLVRAVEQCASVIVVTDRVGNIAYANPAFERETGYSVSEVLGKSPRFLHSGQTPPETYQELWSTITRGQVWRGEFCNRRKDGTCYWEAATIGPVLDEAGTITHFVATKENITARKIAEQELRDANRALAEAKERAEDASQAKSQFLASMSHEMRTPLNAILGLTELLLDDQRGQGEQRYLEVIRSSARSLLALINDLLDLARIEAGRLTLETLDFDLCSLIEELTAALAVKHRARGLDLVIDHDPCLPRRLRGDPTRLRQVLANLLDNAIKFTHEGEVELRVAAEREPAFEDQCVLRFTVRDTGIGIPADRLETIFDKFTQADSSISRRYGGTGLGLAICRQIVEMMGGRLGVRSEPGRGSEFWFTARFGLQPGVREAKPEAGGPFRGRCALVVDDNAAVRRAVRRALQAWGAETEEADSAAAALERRRAQYFDVAYIDACLPDMKGAELARRLAAGQGQGLRALLLAPPGEEPSPEDNSVAGWVRTPVCPRRLLEASQQALAGAAALAFPKPESPAEAAPEDAAARLPARVLVAEDNPANRMLIKAMLRKLGVEVEMVTDGQAALEALSRSEFDLVLMDVQMPELDGLEAVRRLRAREEASEFPQHRKRRLPAIALTAHAMPEDRQRCLEAGMDDYLSKPMSLAELREMFDKWLPGMTGSGA